MEALRASTATVQTLQPQDTLQQVWDHHSPELEGLVRACVEVQDRAVLSELAGSLGSFFNESHLYLRPADRDGAHSGAVTDLPSSLARLLTEMAWIPSTLGDLSRPSDVFLQTSEVREKISWLLSRRSSPVLFSSIHPLSLSLSSTRGGASSTGPRRSSRSV